MLYSVTCFFSPLPGQYCTLQWTMTNLAEKVKKKNTRTVIWLWLVKISFKIIQQQPREDSYCLQKKNFGRKILDTKKLDTKKILVSEFNYYPRDTETVLA